MPKVMATSQLASAGCSPGTAAASWPGRRKAEPAPGVFLRGLGSLLLVFAGLSLTALISLIDYGCGPALSFAIFYLLPIAMGAWWGGFTHGTLLSLAAVATWHQIDALHGSSALFAVQVWNGVVRFGMFVITASLLSRLRLVMLRERTLARTDLLTGSANGRTFYEAASNAVERSLRSTHPMTLAYLDLDHFKQLNDQLGHSAGDAALRHLAQVVQHNIRAGDMLARLGGDEFALLLPDTGGPEAQLFLDRLHQLLTDELSRRGWPVKVSLGAATFLRPSRDIDVMVRHIDLLMYAAKKKGRGRVEHEIVPVCEGPAPATETGAERRATARVLCNQLARVSVEGEGSVADEFAAVRDISTGGVRLRLDRPLPQQTLISVEPLYACGARTLLARVVWSVPEGHWWMHGCVLATELKPDELQCWLMEQAAEPRHELRKMSVV
jgi:diguanylate cyclase (GGDEF)-like protein